MADKRVYRIPKHIDQRFKIWGLDRNGWFAVGGFFVLGLIAFIVWPKSSHFISLLWIFGISFAPCGISWIFLSDERFLDNLYKLRYHQKYARRFQWEADHHVFVQKQETPKS